MRTGNALFLTYHWLKVLQTALSTCQPANSNLQKMVHLYHLELKIKTSYIKSACANAATFL